jgi:hypothetical protein
MTMPSLPPALIDQVSTLVAQYILAKRETYFERAIPLSAPQRRAMAPFYSPEFLEATRVIVLTGERVSNPDFYPMLEAAGFENLPNQSEMAAITFSDCVVAHTPFTDALLFHELVHVEQYRQLRVPQFSDLYLKGFLNGGGYFEIPLEQNAYEVGGRYEREPLCRFSVTGEVARWAAEGRF